MKTKRGFVSNSSTSTFVLIGYALPRKDFGDDFYEELDDLARGDFVTAFPEESDVAYFGIGESWSDDGGMPEGSPVPFDKIAKMRERTKAVLVKNKLWNDKFEKSFGLHYGMY